MKKKTPKLSRLHGKLGKYGRVVVAYSGGVDSTFLLNEAVASLGRDNVVAATAVSETYTREERKRARAICRSLGVRHELVETSEICDPAFRRNNPDRCYHCKKELFHRLTRLARGLKIDAVLEASHAGDRGDYRPGARAKREFKIKSPLLETGFTKDDIRRVSRRRGLATADLPAAACLASRIPYGTSVTNDLLDRIADGERAIRRLGFREFRLRHHGPVARLEFAPSEMERAFRFRRSLSKRIAAAGWSYIALDLLGYRTGSLNETLDNKTLRRGRD